MEILQVIRGQIEWYYKNGDKVGINELLTLQDRLSGNSYYLAEQYGEVYKQYLEKIYNTKTKKIKTFLNKKAEKIADKKITDKLAEKISEDESLAEWADELFGEGENTSLRVLLQQSNAVLNALQQRISYLKIEKNNINN